MISPSKMATKMMIFYDSQLAVAIAIVFDREVSDFSNETSMVHKNLAMDDIDTVISLEIDYENVIVVMMMVRENVEMMLTQWYVSEFFSILPTMKI